MKKLRIFSIIAGLLIFTLSISPNEVRAQYSNVSVQVFYDALSPYGNWIEYPQYGYVWQPYNMPGFRPYATNGHWAWSSEYEWVWVSDYEWGWAPFHYGRWFHDSYYGWLWVPGNEWSPAWVAWRSGGDYYGWAPLTPGFSINIGFNSFDPPFDYWCFISRRYITSPYLNRYYLQQRYNENIYRNSRIVNRRNFYGGRDHNIFINGPERRETERYTGKPVKPVTLLDVLRPGRTTIKDNKVGVFRPNINREDNNNSRPVKVMPSRTQPINNPVVTPPVNERPRTFPPIKEQNPPVVTPPVKDQPRIFPPIREQNPPVVTPPVKDQPRIFAPIREQNPPVVTPPVKDQPRIFPPIKEQNPPVITPPVKEQPRIFPPIKEQNPPVVTPPIKQRPIDRPPVNNPNPPVKQRPVILPHVTNPNPPVVRPPVKERPVILPVDRNPNPPVKNEGEKKVRPFRKSGGQKNK